MAVAKKRNIRRSVGFDKKEMEGYFMIANKDAARAIVNKLTGSQLRLWLYLMMVDSFADLTTNGEKVYHSIPSPQEISIKIGVSPETVEKDIRKLKKLGLYEYRITAWQGHNLSAAKAKEESNRLKKKRSEPKSQQSEGLNKPPERLNKPPENPELLEKSSISDSPQTIQTYTDFKKTLSESERENFWKFVEKKIHNLEKPINDLEAWLASQTKAKQNRWEVYYQSYQEEGRKITRKNSKSNSTAREEKKLAIKNWQEHLKQQEEIYKEQEDLIKKDPALKSRAKQESKTTTDLSTGISDPWFEVHSYDNIDINYPDDNIDGYINSADNGLDSADSDNHPTDGDVNSVDNSGKASSSQESESERTTQAVEGASTDVSSLKQEIDQILNGFSRVDRDAPNIPSEKPDRNLSQKMNEGLQYLRGMEVTKYESEIDERDMGGEE
ncbi:MAG: hypothetical protein AB4368_33895 [Xenococcaceae cyanobacterium]